MDKTIMKSPQCGQQFCFPVIRYKEQGCRDCVVCIGIQSMDTTKPIRKCVWEDGVLKDRYDFSRVAALTIIQALIQALIEEENQTDKEDEV